MVEIFVDCVIHSMESNVCRQQRPQRFFCGQPEGALCVFYEHGVRGTGNALYVSGSLDNLAVLPVLSTFRYL